MYLVSIYLVFQDQWVPLTRDYLGCLGILGYLVFHQWVPLILDYLGCHWYPNPNARDVPVYTCNCKSCVFRDVCVHPGTGGGQYWTSSLT